MNELYQEVDEEDTITTNHSDNDVWTKICQFNDKMPLNTNVLEYWYEKRFSHPLLYALARIVLAVPASQVSVEQCFSTLKFVLNDTAQE